MMRNKIILFLMIVVLFTASCTPKEKEIAKEPSKEVAERDDLGCWPPSCEVIPSPEDQKRCEDWKAGKQVQWPDCSIYSQFAPKCQKLCEYEKKETASGSVKTEADTMQSDASKKVEAHRLPELLTIEIKSGVDKTDEAEILKGVKIMDFYLNEWFGHSIGEKSSARLEATTGGPEVVIENNEVVAVYRTGGQEWQIIKQDLRLNSPSRTAAHEYVHVYQLTNGCKALEKENVKLFWFIEGMAEWLSFKSLHDYGDPTYSISFEQWLSHPLQRAKANAKPLQTYENEKTLELYSYYTLAFDYLMKGRDIKTLDEFCINVGKGQDAHTAFKTAFGMPIEKFYSDFEKYYADYIRKI